MAIHVIHIKCKVRQYDRTRFSLTITYQVMHQLLDQCQHILFSIIDHVLVVHTLQLQHPYVQAMDDAVRVYHCRLFYRRYMFSRPVQLFQVC